MDDSNIIKIGGKIRECSLVKYVNYIWNSRILILFPSVLEELAILGFRTWYLRCAWGIFQCQKVRKCQEIKSMRQRDTEVPNCQSCNNLSQKLDVLVLHYKHESIKYIPILFFSPLINFCMPWRNSQTFKFVLNAATGDMGQKHETVWGLYNRDCWGGNRAGITSRSRTAWESQMRKLALGFYWD